MDTGCNQILDIFYYAVFQDVACIFLVSYDTFIKFSTILYPIFTVLNINAKALTRQTVKPWWFAI